MAGPPEQPFRRGRTAAHSESDLIVHRRVAISRERLAAMLWPESATEHARTNLRHVLHTLRRALPDLDSLVEITPHSLHVVVLGSPRRCSDVLRQGQRLIA